jgi:hypothetical protein
MWLSLGCWHRTQLRHYRVLTVRLYRCRPRTKTGTAFTVAGAGAMERLSAASVSGVDADAATAIRVLDAGFVTT